MNVLAFMWGHGSTAAVMADGEVVASVSEERFSRRKNEEAYPRRAIEGVLDIAGLGPGQLDRVAVASLRFDPRFVITRRYSSFSMADRMREQTEFWYPTLYDKKELDWLEVFKEKVDLEQYPGDWDDVVAFLRNGPHDEAEANAFYQDFRRRVVARHLGIDPAAVTFVHHHQSHAYYAYYASPRPPGPALILTADAWGDDMNASVSVAAAGEIRRLSASRNFNVARLYRCITQLLGMKPDEHEYKVMGLAAYARPEFCRDALDVFRDGLFVDGLGFDYRMTPPDLYFYFRDRLAGQRFDAIAGAIQTYAEGILATWTRNAVATTGVRQVRFGGGIGMNVKAMMSLAALDEVDGLFVCPSPSDESLPMGAAYVVAHEHAVAGGRDPRSTLRPLAHAYLGPDLDAGDVATAVRGLAGTGRHVVREGVEAAHVARALAAGKIVGRCVGRGEFGARALGNRSILADPRDPDVVKRINEKVKSRDFWMPFAPSLLAERAGDYLVNPKGIEAPYMTVAFQTTPRARRDLRAALHQADFTCRPQVVRQEANPAYHALLRAWEALTGVGGVLNTSFNVHGEPIVQTAADAADVFERTGLDALILDRYWIEKAS